MTGLPTIPYRDSPPPGAAGLHDPGWFAPRGHLLGELRAELDWVTGELSTAVIRLSAIETAYNQATFRRPATGKGASGGKAASPRNAPAGTDSNGEVRRREARASDARRDTDAREESLEIDRLFDLQRAARQRMGRLEAVYRIGRCYWLVPVVAMNLRRFLLVGRPDLQTDPGVRRGVVDLALALHAYCWDGPSDDADAAIRDVWLRIESVLPGTLH